MEMNRLSLNVAVWLAVILLAIGVFELKKTEEALKLLPTLAPIKGLRGETADKLTVNAVNGCLQNGTIGLVQVGDRGICWVGPDAATPFEVGFNPLNCPPFTSGVCDFRSGGGQVCSGPANDDSGDEYPYDTFTIGGTNCETGTNGIIMDH